MPSYLNPQYASLRTSDHRLNSTLAQSNQWGSTPDGGMDRISLNPSDKMVRDWFISETRKCNCSIKVDQMGNIFAIRPGQDNSIPPLALGSHLDTQPTGGRYDGVLGVMCALEVLRVVHEADVTTYAPLAVVNWTDEEGARFPPAMLGSGVWAGEFELEHGWSRKCVEGVSLKEVLEAIGYLGEEACSHAKNPLSAHFEVHIEQGVVLDKAERPVGVVKGAQSVRWYNVEVSGMATHTGGTPMMGRKDAMVAAAKMIVGVNDVAVKSPLAGKGVKGTISIISSEPQSVNTMAKRVKMTMDLRAQSEEDMEELERLCRERFQLANEEHETGFELNNYWRSRATTFDVEAVQCVRESAKDIGCDHEMISAIGHDSVSTSRKIPTAMIFARCKDGISHHPTEYTRPEDCAAAAKVLLGAALRYDDLLRQRHGGK